MQRLLGLTLSDPSLMDRLLGEHGAIVNLTRDMQAGGWGLGYYAHGELLVRKSPISSRLDTLRILRDVRSRQMVVVADAASALRSSSATMQPLRFRDWLFAMSGGPDDDATEAFIERCRAEVAGFGKVGPSVPEATLMVLMHALYKHNVLDRRTITNTPVHASLRAAMTRLNELARGPNPMCAILHRSGTLFGLSTGRPLRLAQYRDGGPPSRRRLLRAQLLTDQDVAEPTHVLVDGGIDIASDGTARPI